MRKRLVTLAALIGLTVAWPSTSQAGHHLWKLTHAFSSASGDVQFTSCSELPPGRLRLCAELSAARC